MQKLLVFKVPIGDEAKCVSIEEETEYSGLAYTVVVSAQKSQSIKVTIAAL